MKLRDWLELNKLTTYQFAEQLGCSQGNVANWLAGTIPRKKPMTKIMRATKGAVQPGDFYQ